MNTAVIEHEKMPAVHAGGELVVARLHYYVETGKLMAGSRLMGVGYSGKAGLCRNNPEWEELPEHGPIPRGKWVIHPARFSGRTGPVVLDLTPDGHKAFGRTGFQIHGDKAGGDASRGCIVLAREVREAISIMRKTYGPKLRLVVL